MRNPVLALRSLNVQEEAQYLTIGLCHDVDLVIETPVDLPLREEQLCPLTFSIEYLRGISYKFGASCGVSQTGTSTASWWSTSWWSASSCTWWSSCASGWSTTKSSSTSCWSPTPT